MKFYVGVITLAFLLFGLHFEGINCTTKCYKNEQLGDVESNVYYCPDDRKTECCQTDNDFDCCVPQATITVSEQLQLWGMVAGMAVVMVLLCRCCSSDEGCCSKNEFDYEHLTLAQQLGLKKKGDKTEKDLDKGKQPQSKTSKEYDRSSPFSSSSQKVVGTNKNGQHFNSAFQDDSFI